MLEVRRGGYAVLACLALIAVACGGGLPDSAEGSINEKGSALSGCVASPTCHGDEGTAATASSPEQCRLEYVRCLEVTGDEVACREQLRQCLPSIPPPEPPSTQTGELCERRYTYCVEVTGDEAACREQLAQCQANVPPAP